MKLFDITGFIAVVLGIAGLPGAIERGTGFPQAVALTVTGGFMVYITYKEKKEERDEKSINVVIDADPDVGTGMDSIRSGGGTGTGGGQGNL